MKGDKIICIFVTKFFHMQFLLHCFLEHVMKSPPTFAVDEGPQHTEKEKNGRFCTSQQLLFLLTNTMSHFMLHKSYCTVTVPPYQHNVTLCASQQLLFPLTNTMSHFMLHNS